MKKITSIILLSVLSVVGRVAAEAPTEADYYTIFDMQAPSNEVVEVGGIDFGPDGAAYVCTRHGDIWRVQDPHSDSPKWNIWARYLHEPLGLGWHDGWLYATQRPEVTRMKDEDGDGRADVFECVSDGWGITGDYHEYAFGTRVDPEGHIWVTLCLTGSFSPNTLFRGWVLRVNVNDGSVVPTACGVRSPGGIGFDADGKVYYCDNQGTWNGSSSMKHVSVGSFQGNPNGHAFFPFADGAIAACHARQVMVIYDPYAPQDRAHVDRLPGHNLVRLETPFLGHAPARHLKHMGLIGKVARLGWDGSLTAESFRRMRRMGRKTGKTTVRVVLTQALERGHFRLVDQALCSMALSRPEWRFPKIRDAVDQAYTPLAMAAE